MHHNITPASHPFHFYFNMHIVPKHLLINNPMAQQRVDGYWDNLVDLLEALYKIDESIVLWPFTELTSHKAELLSNPLSLGHTITQITKYFSGLKSRTISPFYVSILLGFSMPFEDLMENVHIMFVDFKATLYKHTLQAEQVTCLGWLLGLREDMYLPTLKKLLQELILWVLTSPILTPQMALSYKSIWDGSKKSDQDKEKQANPQKKG